MAKTHFARAGRRIVDLGDGEFFDPSGSGKFLGRPFSAQTSRNITLLGVTVVTENRLSGVLSEFARTLVTDFPIQGILDHLVLRIVDILPIEAAGVSLISPTTHPRFIAGSDESAVRYEHLQTALGEGPCIAAYETDEPIAIPDLADDERFPRFTANALDEGLMAVFTFPLRNDDRCLGALDLYRTTAGALDAEEMTVAQTLADVTTAYLLNAQARQAKTEFVATVSHELRTPMTSIAGFIELLEDDVGDTLSEDQRGFVDAIRRNSDRLTALADELLMLSSLESGTLRPPADGRGPARGGLGGAVGARAGHRGAEPRGELRGTSRSRDGARRRAELRVRGVEPAHQCPEVHRGRRLGSLPAAGGGRECATGGERQRSRDPAGRAGRRCSPGSSGPPLPTNTRSRAPASV